jgi:flagellar M-ring protein FliF
MLENVVGQGKAVVRVNADLDFRITEKTEEMYDPESPVVRSTQKQLDKTTGPTPTAPRAAGAAEPAGAEKEKTDETINYEINKVISKTVLPVGEIKKISIAVLVDGLYPKNDKGVATYQERPKKDLDSFEDLVRKSSGFNSQRGDQVVISSMPFSRVELEQGMTERSWQDNIAWAAPIIKYGVLTVGLVFMYLFIIRPLLRNVVSTAQSIEVLRQRQIPGDSGVSVSLSGQTPQLSFTDLDNKSLNEVDFTKQLAGADSKKFAELLRNWLK